MQGSEAGQSSAREASLPCPGESSLLIGGVVGLNSDQLCGDVWKERVKKIMIDQDRVFREQVSELHRLYKVQVALTEELKHKGSVDNRFHGGTMNSIPLSNSHEKSPVVGFDLNVAIPEESPQVAILRVVSEKVCSKAAIITSVCPISGIVSKVSHNAGISDIHARNDAKTSVGRDLVQVGEYKSSSGSKSESNKAKPNFIDLGSDSDEELQGSGPDPITETGSFLRLLNGPSCEVGMADGVETIANLDKVKKPVEISLSIQNLVNGLKASSSGVQDIDLNITVSDDSQMVAQSPIAVAQSSVAAVSEVPRLSEITASNTGSSKVPEVDEYAQAAAESLLQISEEKQARYLVDLGKSFMETPLEEDDQPLRPCDSYEEMVLKAEECKPEDFCISSNAYTLKNPEKGSAYKPRDSRMKNFQKEILPCVSTIARHEACTDINAIEGAINLQERPRRRANKGEGSSGDGSSWCKSTRSKRSRIIR